MKKLLYILLLVWPIMVWAQDTQTQTVVEYQPQTGCYVIHTRIGSIDITTPMLLTADEYKRYSEQQFIHKYWQTKIGEVEHDNEKKFDITDMKFNIGPADKVFGPGGVKLKLQGSAELLFGFKHQYVDNPSLTQRSRNNNIFDFDEKIQLNINGTVGTRLSLQMNYNTEASFAADQQNIKLAYKGEEDDIIQSIQAGNVTLDLNSSLIKGSQALFGIKTDLKFGRLKVQALVSQQNSQTQSASSEGGAQMTKFEVQADNYDENKHFFLGYYFRDKYESALTTLPYVTSGVTINRIEVWVTNKRGTYDQARNIVAFTDLGEGIGSHMLDQYFQLDGAGNLPHNNANNLYAQVKDIPQVRDIQQATSYLQGKAQEWSYATHEFTGGEDFDKIESARLLTTSEYTLNSALGYISLKTALQQDEVLAVAYEYTYGGKVYQVGEFASDNSKATSEAGNRAPNLILKMLRSSNTAPIPMPQREKDRYGTWHLMMKNIYSLGASSMTSEKFELYVKYRNDSIGQEVQYLPEGEKTKGKQLIRVLNADRLDQRNNPYPDGRFDYVEGYTVLSSMGRVIFPVLEPFGSHLASQIDPSGTNKKLIDKYCFQELYDSTLVVAQEMSEKNKFVLTGKYKGTNSSEIRLNAMNIPRGSVTVTAGGATLVENVDYTVDYTMGVVTILNQSLIESGTNINVQLENQSTFGLQRRGLYGLHLDYEFNKDFSVGGTLMHLRESPLTTKVNLGSEPLANTIWGLNLNYRTEMMWLTNLLDKIPWMQVTAPSTFQIGAEFAQLIPGHTKDVGSEGTSYVDDFESTTTSIDVHYPSNWFLSSTPSRYAESTLTNDVAYNKNRALLNWYIVDPIFGHAQTNTPQHIKDDPNLLSDHRTRIVYQQELFPNKESLANEDTRLSVLNLTLYPKDRGPYNIYPDGYTTTGELTNPQSRWGGMMRRLDNTDFERSNIEYIEFWLMDPKLTNSHFQGAKLYIDLGDVSEDILKDGKKSFEHGLPVNPNDETMVETTVWGRIPRTTSTTVAFSNETGAREAQDVGLNGLSTEQEFAFEYQGKKPYADYVNYLRSQVDQTTINRWTNDPYSPLRDPAGDNYHYYRGDDYDEAKTSVLERYKHYNGTEGNSPESAGQTYGTASTLTPDIEDINRDNTLGEYEKYYEYEVSLDPMMTTGSNYISEKLETDVTLKNGKTEHVTWYKFKVPIHSDSCTKVGGIRNFKSIRFMRMYLTGCSDTTTLRFATMDLVRGEWRSYTKGLYNDEKNDLYNTTKPDSHSSLDVQAVSIEQDGKREPVNYVLPPGISRQTDPGQAQLISQNEQALVLRVHNLDYNNARAVYKAITMDMRNYKQLKMFVHAEAIPGERVLQDNELSCFIRLGTDMTSNYYEYEVPLTVTPASSSYNNDNEADRKKVWPESNNINFPFSALTNAKTARNKAKRSGDVTVSNTRPYTIYDDANNKPNNRITVMGNPTLEDVEYIVIGVRNHNGVSSESKSTTLDGEVWVNELRLSEFDEEGGVAGLANMGIGISDIAQLNMSGRLETAGYGGIESNVQNRNMDNTYQFQVSAAMELGRFFPEKARLHIPLYVSYSKNLNAPKYDPTDTDIKLKESLETYQTDRERDSIKNMANTTQESTSWSLTNFKVDIHSKKKDMFYDPANFTLSVAFNKQDQSSPEIKKDFTSEHKGSFNYSYNFNPKPWEPFKKLEKVKNVKLLTEFNLYYLPQSWSFNTDMHRSFSQLKMRDFNQYTSAEEEAESQNMSYSKDFTWNRNFDFKYDLTKNLKFSFHTAMNSTVDEGLYTPEVIKDYNFTHDYYEAWKDTVMRSLKTWGQPYTYQQVFTASWNVPFNRIPYMDWLTANASYNGTYTWNRTASTNSSAANFGNTAMSTRSWQVDGQANLETLYGHSDYWKQLNQRMSGRQNRRPFRAKTYAETVNLTAGEPLTITHSLNSESLNITAVDKNGRTVRLRHQTDGGTKVILTSAKTLTDVNVTITTIDPNQRTVGQQVMDYAAYFGTMIRRVQVTYRQTDALTVPGFKPQVGFFGQDNQGNGVYAPGWDFAFGFFPSDYVIRAKDHGWLALSDSVSQPATMARTSDFDVKITLEPFPGFKIQVNGKHYQAHTSSLLYTRDLNAEMANAYAIQETMNGSFNITQVAIGSAFESVGKQSNNFASATFSRFLENRETMRERVQQRYNDVLYPTSDPSQLFADSIRGQKYDASKGVVSNNSADVLVPAFLSAYTKQNVNKMSFDPFLDILHILPNWSLTFDGLGRIPAVKEHFRSITLTHAYTCKYAIGSYTSFSAWLGAGDGSDKTLGFRRDAVSGNPVPSSAYDITSTSLTESFSPLVGVNMTLKNSLLIKTEYRKQRTATLNINAVQLTEGNTDEFVLGTGYTVKDLSFTAKAKNGTQKKVSNDLKITADFSYKNVTTLLRKVEENLTQASSGTKVWGLKIGADYVISQKVNLQFYYDHQSTIPLISSSYPIKNDNVGINLKLMLTR